MDETSQQRRATGVPSPTNDRELCTQLTCHTLEAGDPSARRTDVEYANIGVANRHL
jgi:hypothetical protein